MQNVNIPLLKDADLKGKVVLVRVDHNVVKKGKINDPYRIDSTLATLYFIAARGGKVILMTHAGRPKNKKTGEFEMNADSDIEPIVKYLNKKLQVDFKIPFYEKTTAGFSDINENTVSLVNDLRSGKIDGIYLPNTRWFNGEEDKGEKAEKLAKQMAALADIYVNDAYGSWQAHVSTFHVTKHLPSYAGFLMEKELANLDRIYKPDRPFVSVVAGSKFDTKVASLNALIQVSDHLVLGGVIYNAYLCAKYGIQIQGIEEEDIKAAAAFVEFSKKYPGKLIELPFIVESDTLEGKFEGKFRKHDIRNLKPGTKLNFVLDAAAESFEVPAVKDVFTGAKSIFINAVMGFTPNFTEGTIAMDKLIDSNKDAMKLFGGGDTLEEFKKLLPGLYMNALDNPKYYMFTGGGAVLKTIEDGSFFGIEPVKALAK